MMCISCELLEGIGYKCIHVGLSSCSDEATCGGEALVPIHTFTNFLDFVRKTIPRVPWVLQLCRGALEGLLTWTHWGWSLLCCLNSPSAGPCALFSPHFSPATHPLQPGRQLPPCPPVSGDIPRCPVPLLVSDSLCPSCHTSCSALIPAAKSRRNPPYCSHHKSASLKNTFTSFQSNLTSVLSALALRTGPWADAHVVMPQGPHMNRSTCGTCSSQHRAWFRRRP